jgi:hypothetical protein
MKESQTNPLTMSPSEFCRNFEACNDGSRFAIQHDTMAEVWEKCPRPDWLLWILDKLNQRPDDKTLRLFAVWCVRQVWDKLTDERSRNAVEVAERFANGEASQAELAAASAAARDAASAAARDAASAAASAAARDAAWAAASVAARAAASAAARDAAWAAARDAAWAAASVAAWAAQANQFRTMVANPFLKQEEVH